MILYELVRSSEISCYLFVYIDANKGEENITFDWIKRNINMYIKNICSKSFVQYTRKIIELSQGHLFFVKLFVNLSSVQVHGSQLHKSKLTMYSYALGSLEYLWKCDRLRLHIEITMWSFIVYNGLL